MEKVRCTRNIDCFTKGNEYDYPYAIDDVGQIKRLEGCSLFDMYFEKIETKEEMKEEYDLSTTITRAVKNDDPSIIMKETGKSVEEVCSWVEDKGCMFKCGSECNCGGLSCYNDWCPFNCSCLSKESAIKWIKGEIDKYGNPKNKKEEPKPIPIKPLSAYDAVHVDSQEKWDFVSSKLGYTWDFASWDRYRDRSYVGLNSKLTGLEESWESVVSFEEWLDLTGNTEGWLLFIGRNQFISEQTVLNLCVKNVAVTSEIPDAVLPPKHILGYDTINGLTGSNNFIIGKYYYDKLTLTNDNCNRFDITKKEVIFVSLEEDDIVEYKALPVQHCSKVEFLTNEE